MDRLLAVSPDGRSIAFATNRNGPTQILVSGVDGTDPRVLVSAIPPFDSFGDNTAVDGITWSPDEKWIAFLTEPGVGHGDEDAKLFLIPAAGGPLRLLVNCSQGLNAPPWSEDSRFVYFVKTDPEYHTTHFRIDVATGQQTGVEQATIPRAPLVPLPQGAEQPHVAEGGRFLYYVQQQEQYRSRMVAVQQLPIDANGK